jgi:hypothetical protein
MKWYITILTTLCISLGITNAYADKKLTETKIDKQTINYKQQLDEKSETYAKYVISFIYEYREIQLRNPIDFIGTPSGRQAIRKGIVARESYLRNFNYDKNLVPEKYSRTHSELELVISRKLEGIDMVKEGIAEASDDKVKKGLTMMYFANSKLSDIEDILKIEIIEL